MSAADWGMLLALSVLWGGSFFFSKIALGELPPFTVVFARVFLAALPLYAWLRITRQPLPRDPSTWAAFFGMGLLNNLIPFSLIFWGQTSIASGLAAILNATTPLFGVIVAHGLTTDEKATGGKLAGVVLGIAGVAALIGPGALTGPADTQGSDVFLGELACLGASLSYAFASVFGRRFRRLGIAPGVTAFGQLSATSLMVAPIAFLVDRPFGLPWPSPIVWAALIGLAFISTAFAYVLFFRILASAGATNVMLVTLLIPVSAVLLGAAFLGEHLSPRHIPGILLIALGLAAIDGRAWRLLRGTVHAA